MSSNVIDIVIRARDDASAALRATQGAIDEVAKAERDLRAAEQARAAADAAAAEGSGDAAEALRRQREAADAAAAAARRLADAEAAAAAAAERLRRAGGGPVPPGGGPVPPGGGAGGGGGTGNRGLDDILAALSHDLGGLGDIVRALGPTLDHLKSSVNTTAQAIVAAGARLGRPGPGPVPPPPPPPGPNPPPPPGPGPGPGPGPNPPPPPGPRGNDSAAQAALLANLKDVFGQLSNGADPLLVLIQQGPALAAAIASASSATALFNGVLGVMKGAAVAAAGVLGPLAVALAAGAAAYSYMANETQIANEAMGIYAVNVEAAEAKVAALASRLDEIAGMHGKVTDRLKENARELAVLSGYMTKEEAARQRSIETIQEQAKAETEAARLRLAAQGDLLRNMEQELTLEQERSSGMLGAERRAELEAGIDASKREIASLEQGLRARQSAMQIETDQVNLIARLGEAKRKAAEAERDAAKATAAHAKEMARLKSEWQSTIKLFEDAERELRLLRGAMELPEIAPPNFVGDDLIKRARELGDALDGLAPAENVLSKLEQLQLVLSDIAELNAGSGGRFGGLEQQAQQAVDSARTESVAGAGGEIDSALADFGNTMNAMSDAATQKAAGVGSMIGDIIGGDISGVVTSALSSAGPIGAALGGMLGGLSALGEQGAGQTAKMITGYAESIMKGIINLPQLIVKALPDLVVMLVTEFVPALLGMLPRLAVAIAIEMPIAILRGYVKWWREIGGFKGIARAIADGVREWWTSTWDRIKMWLRDIFTPNKDKREQRREDRADRNEGRLSAGQALVAVGQSVGDVFRGDNRSRGGPNASTAAGPTIVLQGDFTPDFVPSLGRRLDRYNRPGGLRSGTVSILGGT